MLESRSTCPTACFLPTACVFSTLESDRQDLLYPPPPQGNPKRKDWRTIKCPKIVPLLRDCTRALSSALMANRTACRLSMPARREKAVARQP
jgi:hypothetical protein